MTDKSECCGNGLREYPACFEDCLLENNEDCPQKRFTALKSKMKNYNGHEMTIRTTNKGKFQVLPVPSTPQDMSRAPVFETQAEAEAYILRPMPKFVSSYRLE